MAISSSAGVAVSPARTRHGLYALIASFLALLISVGAFVRPSLHPFLWFAGRLFRRAAVSYRFSRGLGAGVTGPYLIAEAIVNVLAWALLIYAAEYCFYRWRERSAAGIAS